MAKYGCLFVRKTFLLLQVVAVEKIVSGATSNYTTAPWGSGEGSADFTWTSAPVTSDTPTTDFNWTTAAATSDTPTTTFNWTTAVATSDTPTTNFNWTTAAATSDTPTTTFDWTAATSDTPTTTFDWTTTAATSDTPTTDFDWTTTAATSDTPTTDFDWTTAAATSDTSTADFEWTWTTAAATSDTTTAVIITCYDICTGDGQQCVNQSTSGCVCKESYENRNDYCVKVCPQTCPTNSACKSADLGCECDAGYHNESGTCEDINECNEECLGDGESCTNQQGGYLCGCEDGYYPLEGGGCEAEDPECPECQEHSACRDPSTGCECVTGWMGDPKDCQDVDECLTACQDPTLQCTNSPGSYRCSCIAGYVPDAGGESCAPVSCDVDSVSCTSVPDKLMDACVIPVTFPLTLAGYSATSVNVCPKGTSNEGKILGTRSCNLVGEWSSPTWLSSCDDGLNELANTTIENEEQRQEVSTNLEVITSTPEELDTEDIETTTEVMQEVTEAENITTQVATSLVSTIGNLVESPSLVESEKSKDILAQLDEVSAKVVLKENETYVAASGNVSMLVVQAPSAQTRSSFSGVGIAVLLRPNTSELGFREDQLQVVNEFMPAGDLLNQNRIQSVVYVPPSALNTGTSQQGARVSFYVFGNANLFPRDKNSTSAGGVDYLASNDSVIDSIVLSATVEGVNVSNLPQNDRVAFTTLRRNISSDGEDRCAFWDENVSEWSVEGCEVDLNNTNENMVSCKCDHLTNFATLLDAGNVISEENAAALDLITIIGCSISSFALFLVIVVFLFVRTTREGRRFRGAYLLVSLCTALLGLNLCLIFSNLESVESSKDSCRLIAIFMHFFLISACAWMNCEAVNLYMVIVKVVYNHTQLRDRTVIIISSIWGWLMPAVLIAGLSISKPSYYERDDEACWVTEEMVIFIVVIPVGILVTFNILLYAIVTYSTCCKRRSVETESFSRSRRRKAQRKKISLNICIFVTIGVTWAFGLLIPASLNDPTAATVFAYIFTILNSLQGLALFLLYIIRNKEMRQKVLTEMVQLSTTLGLTTSSEVTSSNPSRSNRGYSRTTQLTNRTKDSGIRKNEREFQPW